MNNNRIKKIGLKIKGKVYYFFFNFSRITKGRMFLLWIDKQEFKNIKNFVMK